MGHIVGCIEAHELTTCKQGANQHAHIILRKSVKEREKVATPPAPAPAPAPQPQPSNEVIDMDKMLKVASATLQFNDVTKAYFLALEDDKAKEAFLEKSCEDQAAEAAAAKKVVDDAKIAEEAAAKGLSEKEVALEKRLTDQQAEIDTLKAERTEADLRKRIDTEFAGYPGTDEEAGPEVVYKALKAAAALPEDARKTVEAGLKRTADMAKSLVKERGSNVVKSGSAQERYKTAAMKIADDDSISLADAKKKLLSTPAGKKLQEEVMAEEANPELVAA